MSHRTDHLSRSNRLWQPCRRCLAILVALTVLTTVARAEVRLPSIYSDNAVLQQEVKFPVWGWAEPGENVTVAVAGQKQSAAAGQDGRWKVTIGPLKASQEPLEMVVSGKNTLTVRNILVGDVWLCSGQSNMDMKLSGAGGGKEKAAAADYPQIRVFAMTRLSEDKPLDDVRGSWVICTPASALTFTAVGFYFGAELHQVTGQPVGLISCALGGSSIIAWFSEAALKSDLDYAAIVSAWQSTLARVEAQTKQAQEQVEAAKKAGREPPAPGKPARIPVNQKPMGCYNGMLHAVVGYGIRGAIWYQGEADAGAKRYLRLFPAMVQSWRQEWGQGQFPFFFVQLPGYKPAKPEPSESGWAEMREIQELCLAATPDSAMAVTIDLGDAGNIHPLRKADVGHRLALAALATVYGRKVVYQSPLYEAQKIDGPAIQIKFKNVGGGLCTMAAPTADSQAAAREPTADPLKGFAIAGADKKFVWAEAKIDGETVRVWSDKVRDPKFVRYGWADNPDCNLYNREGLPAGPFRTDR